MSNPIAVPLLDLKAQYAAIKDEIDAAVRSVIDSQHFIMGPQIKALEEEIGKYCGVKHAIGCASGTDAILLALMALEIGAGDDVICPAYTFFATAGSIARTGARPVFADIDPATYNIDVNSVRRAAGRCKRLKAIMPVHLFGQSVDLDAFEALGRELGVPVIEDAAQAIGTVDENGHKAGSRGLLGCFSFFPSKNLGGFGDGGLVTTNDDALAERIRALRVHGGVNEYAHQFVGMNSRLDALQAAVLRVKLRHLDAWSAGRRKNAEQYDRAFARAGAVDSATPLIDGGFPLRTPRPARLPAQHIYNQYVIRVPAPMRDALRTHLSERTIGNKVYYPLSLHQQECFRHLGWKTGDLPESESAAKETIALPIYPELTNEQLQYVADTIVTWINSQAKTAAVRERETMITTVPRGAVVPANAGRQ